MTLAKRFSQLIQVTHDTAALSTQIKAAIDSGADEIWLCNSEKNSILLDEFCELVNDLSEGVYLPLVAWGDISLLTELRRVAKSMADRVVISPDFLLRKEPQRLLKKWVDQAGPDRLVIHIPVRRLPEAQSQWEIATKDGKSVQKDLLSLLPQLVDAGASELLLQLLPAQNDKDGSTHLELVNRLGDMLSVPLVLFVENAEKGPDADLLYEWFVSGGDGVVCAFSGGQSIVPLKARMSAANIALRPTAQIGLLQNDKDRE